LSIRLGGRDLRAVGDRPQAPEAQLVSYSLQSAEPLQSLVNQQQLSQQKSSSSTDSWQQSPHGHAIPLACASSGVAKRSGSRSRLAANAVAIQMRVFLVSFLLLGCEWETFQPARSLSAANGVDPRGKSRSFRREKPAASLTGDSPQSGVGRSRTVRDGSLDALAAVTFLRLTDRRHPASPAGTGGRRGRAWPFGPTHETNSLWHARDPDL